MGTQEPVRWHLNRGEGKVTWCGRWLPWRVQHCNPYFFFQHPGGRRCVLCELVYRAEVARLAEE
jgi:hypothetical protein